MVKTFPIFILSIHGANGRTLQAMSTDYPAVRMQERLVWLCFEDWSLVLASSHFMPLRNDWCTEGLHHSGSDAGLKCFKDMTATKHECLCTQRAAALLPFIMQTSIIPPPHMKINGKMSCSFRMQFMISSHIIHTLGRRANSSSGYLSIESSWEQVV